MSAYKTITQPILTVASEELRNVFPSFKKIGGIIGTGTYGQVYYCRIEDEDCVVKVQQLNSFGNILEIQKFISSCSHEIEMMLYLQDYDMSPLVYYYKFFYNPSTKIIHNIIVMENLLMSDHLIESNKVNACEMAVKALKASDLMIKLGVSHRDYKWSNIGCRITNGQVSVVPFDFGLSKYINNVDKLPEKMNRLLLISDSIGLQVDFSTKQKMFDLLKPQDIPDYVFHTDNDLSVVGSFVHDFYMFLYTSS
jgi:serine/threonine protein kinase